VKELFAKKFTVENIRRELQQLLHVQGYRHNMLESYRELQERLGEPGASGRAAAVICRRLLS
jgi:lipid-A-disaccharide synthase